MKDTKQGDRASGAETNATVEEVSAKNTAAPKPLSVDQVKQDGEMMELLASYKVTPAEFAAAVAKSRKAKSGAKKTDHRKVHMTNIREQAGQIAADHGSALVTAEEIRQSLDAKNLANNADGRPLRKANAIGDACGLEGLQLPRIQHAGRWHYDVSMAGASSEEKAKRQEQFDRLPDEALKAICAGQRAVNEDNKSADSEAA